MKDYYRILGVPESSSLEEIKKAFRRQALQHHPDRNPGREKEAEARFKEINEAYAAIGDEARRERYDRYRKSPFAYAGPSGPAYDGEQVFRSTFSDQAFFSEMDKFFRDSGLRFDHQFVNGVFGGKGAFFQVYTWPPRPGGGFGPFPTGEGARPRKPGLGERLFLWVVRGLMKKLMGFDLLGPMGRDLEARMVISHADAETGAEKEVSYRRGKTVKRLMVKVPAGTRDGTRMRLRGMGAEGTAPGDLYVTVKVKG